MQKPNLLQDSHCSYSTIRVATILSAILGSFIIISGLVAMFMQLDSGVIITCLTTGSSLISVTTVAKAYQQKHEK